MVSTIERFHCIQHSQLSPNGVHYREVPTVYSTAGWVPVVSTIETFHCILCFIVSNIELYVYKAFYSMSILSLSS